MENRFKAIIGTNWSINLVAYLLAGIHVAGGFFVCIQVLTFWGHPRKSATILNSLISTLQNDWFLLSLHDGTYRSFICATTVILFSLVIYSPLVFAQKNNFLRAIAFSLGVIPLLYNFTLKCILWKTLLMGRPIDGLVIETGFSASNPETAVLFALLGQYVPLGLIMLYPQVTRVSPSRLLLLRSYSSSYWLAFKWEILPTFLFRLFSIFALVFVLVFTDPTAVRVIGGGSATNLTSFVIERFKQNDYDAASAGAIYICIILIVFLLITLKIAIRQSDDE